MCKQVVDINKYNKIFEVIEKLLEEKDTAVVAIDGGSAAGKTTLAQLLVEKYNCGVFHMDDFFLPIARRKEGWKEEPAGNIDKERFLEEVLLPISRGEDVEYHKFDCMRQEISESVEVKFNKLCIVEGAYSTHPSFENYYDLKIFLDVNPDVQKNRISKRNTPDKQEMFYTIWVPLEKKYFETFSIKEKCDIVVTIDE